MRLVKQVAKSVSKENVKLLFDWIDAGKRRDNDLFLRMEDWRKMFRGSSVEDLGLGGRTTADPSTGGDEVTTPINLAYLHARTLLPSIFAKDPSVDVLPPREEDAPNAPVWEAIINFTLPRIRFKQIFKKSLLDAIVMGEGWVKCGWVPAPPEPVDLTNPNNDLSPIDVALLSQGLTVGPDGSVRSRTSAPRVATAEAETGSNPAVWLKQGSPFITRLCPADVVVDPMVPDRDPHNARFVAIRYFKPLDEVKATPDYTVPADVDSKALHTVSEMKHLLTLSGAPTKLGDERLAALESLPDGTQIATVWEVWVYQLVGLNLFKQVVTLMEGVERPIRQPIPWQDLVGSTTGYPIHRIVLNEVPDDVPMSEFESWADLQACMNWLAGKALSNVKRFSRMFEVDPNALVSPKEMDKVKRGEDGTVIQVRELGKAIAPLPTPTNASDTLQMLQYVGDTAQLISGLSENRKGEATARTATEASIIEGATRVKLDEKSDTVVDIATDIITTLVGIIKRFVDRSYVVRLTGEGGAVAWQRFSQDEIDWMPDLQIRFESMRFSNQQRDLQRWQAVLQMVMQIFPLMPTIRLDIVVAKMMKALGVEDVTEIMGDVLGPAPREQQYAEIAMLLGGIPVEPRISDPQPIHIQVLKEFMASMAWPDIKANDPAGAAMVEMHLQMHLAMLEKIKGLGAAMEMEARQEAGPEMAANQARGARPEFPETPGGGQEGTAAAPAIPGGGNQRESY